MTEPNGWTRAEAMVLGELTRLSHAQDKTAEAVQSLQVAEGVSRKALERIEQSIELLLASDKVQSTGCSAHHQETAQVKDEVRRLREKMETLQITAPFRVKLLAFAGGVLALGGVIVSYLYHVLG